MSEQTETSVGRGRSREEAICSAVMDLLVEGSFDRLTVDAVAAKAKASKATIYRRWSGRDDLVLDVLRREFLGDGRAPTDTGSLRGDLLATLRRDMGDPAVTRHKLAAIRSISTAACAAPGLVSAVTAEIGRIQLELWSELLRRAKSRGEISGAVSPVLCTEVLRGQLCAQALFEPENGLSDEYLEHLVDDIVLPVVHHAGTVMPVTTC
jgi:AcrR family transcriptional regulator